MPKTKILNNLFRSNNYFLSDPGIVRQGKKFISWGIKNVIWNHYCEPVVV